MGREELKVLPIPNYAVESQIVSGKRQSTIVSLVSHLMCVCWAPTMCQVERWVRGTNKYELFLVISRNSQTDKYIYVTVLRVWSMFQQSHLKTAWSTSRAVPNPRAMDWYGLWPIRNQGSQQKVSGGWASEASSVFTLLPELIRSAACIRFFQWCETQLWTTQGRDLVCTPYENLMPNDIM